MLMGEKARLGIEFDLNDDPGGAWLFGEFCYWIGNEQIGDFDQGTSLRDVLFSMLYIIGDAGNRVAPSLALCNKKELFKLITTSLTESDDLSELISSDLIGARFDICPRLDIFGAWDIYLMDTRDLSRVVYSADGGENVSEIELAPSEFDTIASDIYGKLNDFLEKYGK